MSLCRIRAVSDEKAGQHQHTVGVSARLVLRMTCHLLHNTVLLEFLDTSHQSLSEKHIACKMMVHMGDHLVLNVHHLTHGAAMETGAG
jgi:hypothetical protein